MVIKLLKSFSLILLMIFSLHIFLNIKVEEYQSDYSKKIKVNLKLPDKEQKIVLKYGACFNDLVKIIDTDLYDCTTYSLDYPLANEQIITLDYKENISKISINTDNIDDLIKLPGIGQKTAEKILAYRQIYGDFKSIVELKNVSGIGDKKYEKIQEYITV